MDSEIFTKNEDINLLMEDYENVKESYKTKNRLTKYEKTKVLSERTSQINDGSQIFIDKGKFNNAYNIALEEFKLKKIPFIIKRPYGNHFEYWKITDLY
jgi:DNA-directed RNA polymerase subunit K/omega